MNNTTAPSYNYTSITPGTYYLKNVALGTYMTVEGGKDVNQQNISLSPKVSGSSAQQFVITATADGYKMRPKCSSSRLVNAWGSSPGSGANVNLYDDCNESSQWWKFEAVSGGYIIHSSYIPSCVLDANEKSNVLIYSRHGGANQQWVLEPVEHTHDKGTYKYFWKSHPHYNCYECSICGTIWEDRTSSNFYALCTICCKPGKPELLGMSSEYAPTDPVVFTWNATEHTTHYILEIEQKNDDGNWGMYYSEGYVSSGLSLVFDPGEYRARLTAYNSALDEEDGSGWLHTPGDYVQFTVTGGDEGACVGHKLGTFNGCPACVDRTGKLHVCENNFPDENFRGYLLSLWAAADGYLTVEECENIIYIDKAYSGFYSLCGIEYLFALEYLNCAGNAITELDLSHNVKLEYLDCHENQLTALDVSNCSALQDLACFRNQLTELDISDCYALEDLSCWINQLTELDLSSCSMLTSLRCDQNQLTELVLSHNSELSILECSNNRLTTLDLSALQNLRNLQCYSNAITELDPSHSPKLQNLHCASNALTALDVSRCPELGYLYCYNNLLTTLDLSGNPVLRILYCADNQLTTLDLSGCTGFYQDGTNLSSQTASFTATAQNGKWVVNLSAIVGAENVKNILSVSSGTWNKSTGIVTFNAEPEMFSYTYDTGYPDAVMDVNLQKAAPGSAHTATVNGVKSEYAPGEKVKLSVPAFYTANGWAYRFVGWSGDADCIVDPGSPDTAFIMPEYDIVLTPVYILVGDLNGDGVLDASDALNMARILAGSVPGKAAADIDGDGMITTSDVVYMRRYLAGTYTPAK